MRPYRISDNLRESAKSVDKRSLIVFSVLIRENSWFQFLFVRFVSGLSLCLRAFVLKKEILRFAQNDNPGALGALYGRIIFICGMPRCTGSGKGRLTRL